MDANELIWNLYLSERDFIQHHENQRTTVSNILGAISAGLIVAIGTGNLSNEIQILISFILFVIGLFGYLFCFKLYALITLHATRSYEYLKILDENYMEIDVDEVKNISKNKNKQKFKKIDTLGLNTIWNIFHLFISLTGIGLIIYFIVK